MQCTVGRSRHARSPHCRGVHLTLLVFRARLCDFVMVQEAMAAEAGPGGAAAAGPPQVHARHFDAALRRVFPSVSRQARRLAHLLKLGTPSRFGVGNVPRREGADVSISSLRLS